MVPSVQVVRLSLFVIHLLVGCLNGARLHLLCVPLCIVGRCKDSPTNEKRLSRRHLGTEVDAKNWKRWRTLDGYRNAMFCLPLGIPMLSLSLCSARAVLVRWIVLNLIKIYCAPFINLSVYCSVGAAIEIDKFRCVLSKAWGEHSHTRVHNTEQDDKPAEATLCTISNDTVDD